MPYSIHTVSYSTVDTATSYDIHTFQIGELKADISENIRQSDRKDLYSLALTEMFDDVLAASAISLPLHMKMWFE